MAYERIVGCWRLGREHVGTIRRERPCGERLGDSLLVDKVSTACVYDYCPRTDHGERGGVDHVACGTGQRTMERYDICCLEERVGRYGRDIGRQFRGTLACDSQDPHAESVGGSGDTAPYIPHSDNAHSLPLKLSRLSVEKTEIGRRGPPSPAAFVGVVGDVVGHIEQMGDDHLGDAGAAVGRNIGDDDAMGGGVGGVNDVVACGEHADICQLGQLGHDAAVHDNLVSKDNVAVDAAGDNV